MRLLIFLVLCRYGLACKYRKNSNHEYITGSTIAFSNYSGIAFSYF